jgi:hypothetical protein
MRGMDRNDAEQQLQDAARSSPALAAMVAGVHDDPGPRYRRIAAFVAAAALGVGALLAATSLLAPKRAPKPVHEPASEIDHSEYLLPIKAQPTTRGEETAPFTGFALSVETDPPGAVVSVGGAVRGEAPVLANVDCRRGEKLEIRAEKAGFRAARREVGCRADTLLKLTLHLER